MVRAKKYSTTAKAEPSCPNVRTRCRRHWKKEEDSSYLKVLFFNVFSFEPWGNTQATPATTLAGTVELGWSGWGRMKGRHGRLARVYDFETPPSHTG